MAEDDLIRWLREQDEGLRQALGDDVATTPALSRPVATVDSQIAGVHFPPELDSAHVARRLLAVNLSDLAAAGASPRWGLLSLAAPPAFDHRRFFRAFLAASKVHGLQLLGGDLSSTEQLVATLTAVGEAGDSGPLSRRGAAPGHRLWVSGPLGLSAAGRHLLNAGATLNPPREQQAEKELSDAQIQLPAKLPPELHELARRCVLHHLLPRPHLALGQELAHLSQLGEGTTLATMDLSDGLARDLPRMAAASGTGAQMELAALRQASGDELFHQLCLWLQRDPLDLILRGGEDYCLLAALPTSWTFPRELCPPGCAPLAIGTCTSDPKLVLASADGHHRPWPDGGWDHLGP
ncbi:MAG: thiamine-phosphate kinase [Acidobacteriota bacterium]